MTGRGGLRVAFAFLTRVPIPHAPTPQGGALSRAAVWFPLAGAFVGLVVGLVRLGADLVLPGAVAAGLAVAAGILVTGGLHEDGLADVADGLGAHVDASRRREIMRDPRVGTYGALALVLAVGLGWSLLAALGPFGGLLAAVTAHAAARWGMVLAAVVHAPAAPDGLGALLRPSRRRLGAATALAVVLVAAVAGAPAGILALLAAGGVAVAAGGAMASRLGGTSGDVFGAVAKLAELAALAVLVALWT